MADRAVMRYLKRFRESSMRRRTFRKVLILLAPGCLLWASCPSGTIQFLAPALQPALAQVFSAVAGAITDSLLEQGTQP